MNCYFSTQLGWKYHCKYCITMYSAVKYKVKSRWLVSNTTGIFSIFAPYSCQDENFIWKFVLLQIVKYPSEDIIKHPQEGADSTRSKLQPWEHVLTNTDLEWIKPAGWSVSCAHFYSKKISDKSNIQCFILVLVSQKTFVSFFRKMIGKPPIMHQI